MKPIWVSIVLKSLKQAAFENFFDAFSHGKVCLIFEDFFGYGLLWLHPLWCMKGDLYLDQDQSTIESI